MAETTSIEWVRDADGRQGATWNPVTGCSVVSPGCTNCYAMRLAGTRLRDHPSRAGLTRITGGRPKWTGEVRLNEEWLVQPLRWRKPRAIFVCAHGDLFHESVPYEWIDRVFAVMALCPHHTFQVLTKRAARMREYFAYRGAWTACMRISQAMGDMERGGVVPFGTSWGTLAEWPLPHVWLGVSAEDQQRANERIPDLLATPAAVRWVSCEPLLGEIDAEPFLLPVSQWSNGWLNNYPFNYPKNRIDWVVVGGESGPGARPMNPDWARRLRDQCAAAGVPFFMKQLGAWASVSEVEGPQSAFHTFDDGRTVRRVGKKRAGRLLDGVEHNGMPEQRPLRNHSSPTGGPADLTSRRAET